MKARESTVLAHAVDIGAKHGVRRFFKHRDDAPSEKVQADMADALAMAILDELDTWFAMEDEGE
jgi:hypothetical protein